MTEGGSKKRPKDATERAHARLVGRIANALSARILEVTAPVYWVDDNGEPEAKGSSVLLQLGGTRFLVTAGHVLDCRYERPLIVPAAGRFLPVAGDVTRLFAREAGNILEDFVDVTIVRLAGTEWEGIDLKHFLAWDELDHTPPVPNRNIFGILGFPLTKQRAPIRGTQVAFTFSALGLESPEATYGEMARDPTVSLMVGIDKRKVWGPEGRLTAPDLWGVSGSGLWRFARRIEQVATFPTLSAIATEWHRKIRHKHVLGTRIRPILASLTQAYPDVRTFVEDQLGSAEPSHEIGDASFKPMAKSDGV